MKKLKAILFIVSTLVTVVSISYGATLNSMNKAQIEKAFVGKTLISIGVDNLNGRTVNNSNSVFFDGYGNAFGKMGHKPANLLVV